MKHLVSALFNDSKHAGDAIAELKNQGFTHDISLITKNLDENVDAHDVKKDVSDGTATGAAAGAIVGALSAVLAGISSLVIPGLGLIVFGGPLYAGLAGAAAGALTGGVLGGLIDLGLPEEKAKMYEHHIQEGQVLVSVSVEMDKEQDVVATYEKHNAHAIESIVLRD